MNLTLDLAYLHMAHEQALPILPLLSDDVTWWMNGHQEDVVPFAGIYQGKREVLAFLREFFSALDIIDIQRQLDVHQGNRVVAHIDVTAAVPSTGKTLRLEMAQVWEFDDCGRVVAFHSFHDTWLLWQAFQPGGETELVDRRVQDDYTIQALDFDPEAVVLNAYAAFFAGDLQSALTIMGPDSIWMLKGDDRVPYVGTFYGPQGFVDFVTNMLSVAAYTAIPTFPYVVTEGNRVDVYIIEPQVNIYTGEQSTCHIIHSFTINPDGTLRQMTSYNDTYEIHSVFGPHDD